MLILCGHIQLGFILWRKGARELAKHIIEEFGEAIPHVALLSFSPRIDVCCSCQLRNAGLTVMRGGVGIHSVAQTRQITILCYVVWT